MAERRSSHWDRVYATRRENELSWYESSPAISLDLIVRAGLPKSAAIIDIGGGLSRLADELVEAGYSDVTVLDVSAQAIALGQSRAGRSEKVHGIVADVTEWRPDRSYAIWHDRAVLHFLVEAEGRGAYRRALLSGLAPGGQAIIGTFAPTGPERCSGLAVRRYGADDLTAFLGPHFRLLESFETDHPTPAGTLQRFHFVRFERL